MENHQKTSFTFEIDDFSEKEAAISSPIFVNGGCEWFVKVHPKRHHNKDHVSVYLHVANPESLQPGWKRRATHSFIMLNQSGKELKRTSEACDLFCTEVPAWGYPKVLPLSKVKEEGFLENNKLIIKVEVKVVEVVHKGDLTGTEMLDFYGFQVLYSQVSSVSWIFSEHPDIAVDFKPKNQLVKTAYMNVLLGLIETLNKPTLSLSETELSNAHSQMRELAEAGFKLDWLKTKLDEVTSMRKKVDADGSRFQQLEESFKNFKLMGLDFKLDCLKSSLHGVSLEKKKSDDADGSQFQQLERRVKNLELMELDSKLDCLKTKLEEVSLERKKSDDADGSRVQQLEDRFKNVELMVSELRVELDKEKAKSCDDGFLLVNEFA